MIVVPDAGPLIYLAGTDNLELLRLLFGRVVTPRLVHSEVVVAGAGLLGASEVAQATWIEIEDSDPDPTLMVLLDVGEAAAIPLAERLGATLLCDDGDARKIARDRGLTIIGTLGVLLRAKRAGHLSAIAPIVSRMASVGMFISPAILSQLLDAAGESDEDASLNR